MVWPASIANSTSVAVWSIRLLAKVCNVCFYLKHAGDTSLWKKNTHQIFCHTEYAMDHRNLS